MEEEEKRRLALTFFSEALTCSPEVYTWRYSPDGELLETNCGEHVYHRIFEHTGALAYMMDAGTEERSPLILSAELGIMWCAVYGWDGDSLRECYVIGPVFHSEVDNWMLENAIQLFQIDPKWRPLFVRAMQGIPVVSSILFFQQAVMLHYFVSGEKIRRSDLRFQREQTNTELEQRTPQKSRHQIYQVEKALLRMVRDGDLNYYGVMERAGILSSGVGVTTKDPVQRAVLSASNFTALCTRAAIEGGIMPDTAYTLGDSYIQALTECRTIGDVRTVNHTMYEDFIRRVHQQRCNPHYSQQIQTCVSYIEMHLNENLSLQMLADQIGYSPYHLSRKFKAETGENIRDYIRYARIERAKLLLSTTDLSVRDIAEQLQFCAPSHFSKVFREVTGMLPQQYRKEEPT